MISDGIINGIVFLLSFLDCSLLVCRNKTDFLHVLCVCVLILYSKNLLDLFFLIDVLFEWILVFQT
jgi:hypothetical protein